jgi:membrane protein YdbS with pleckstrin-like domain
MIILARKSTETKRAVIKKLFNMEDSQIRSTSHDDPRIRKFTSAGWALAFVMAGVILAPIVTLGDNIWTQILTIVVIELCFLLVGLVVIRACRIMNWYLECYICDFKFYRIGFVLIVLAIILGNISYFVPMYPSGLVFQLAAFGVMAAAMYFMISPILKETKYYTEAGIVEETSGSEAEGT